MTVRWPIGILLLFALLLPLPVVAANFQVDSVQVSKQDEVYYVSARFNLQTSPRLRELLDRGVTLALVTEAKVEQPRPLIWGDTIALVRQVRYVQYHPLTRLYLVDEPSTGARRIFAGWPQALAYLERVRDLPLVDEVLLSPNESYEVYVRIRLDNSVLPLALRLSAMTSDWGMDSPWKSVALRP
ncbi:MAG: DUF4390 domain-containing protein [Pseudomonadota bacterium]